MEDGRFLWPVSEGGYEWQDVVDRNHQTEGRGLVALHAGHFRHIEPLEHFTGLFRTFAETSATEEGVKDFADRYGFLGKPFSISLGDGEEGAAEDLAAWRKEIGAVRLAIDSWDVIRGGDAAAIYTHYESRIVPEQYRYSRWPYDRPTGLGEAWATIIGGVRGPRPVDLLGRPAARVAYSLSSLVNDSLAEVASPAMVMDQGTGSLRLQLMPHTLIGAIWLQLALAIDGNREYRRCETCGTWFEIRPPVTRNSRKFCSNACRTRAYRQRSVGESQ